eukprot:245519-Pleurochrysis_carterae.AAC.1
MTTASGHRCASPTSASMSAPSPRLLPRSARSTLSASQLANSTRTNAASSTCRWSPIPRTWLPKRRSKNFNAHPTRTATSLRFR